MNKLYSLLFFLFISVSYSQILFEDEASLRGITATTNCDGNGLGISFVDYDNDGWDDITIPTRNGQPLKFYKNYNGFFVEEVLISPQITYPTRSVSWVDYDNDGDRDLFVVSDSHGNRLYNQISDGTFLDVTLSSGLFTDNVSTFSVSWGDIDNDGCLDLFISNRTTNAFFPNFLFKNNCDGTFTNVSVSAGISNESRLTFGAAFLDYNNDGFQDIYVINDKVLPNRLYKNNGDSTFTDVSEITGAGITVDAMSVTVDDYNADGFLDIYITNTDIIYPGRTYKNVLLKNINGVSFEDVSTSSATDLEGWCWGANFLDAENDSDLDLYVSCLYTLPPSPDSYGFYENINNMAFSQPSNIGFLNNDFNSFGTAIGDANNDGKSDILVINDAENIPNLWVNNTNTTNNFLAVTLEGITSNKDGVGSKIEISVNGQKQYRYILNGESYISQNSFKELFGVGNNNTIDYVRVYWLSGVIDTIFNVTVNQSIILQEGMTLSNLDYQNSNPIVGYPNPIKEKLHFNSAETIDGISVYNLLGQEVLKINPRSVNPEVNISSLKSGNYFAKVTIGNRTETIKIIKE